LEDDAAMMRRLTAFLATVLATGALCGVAVAHASTAFAVLALTNRSTP
jgi:hypothetical protein